jgi:hypothetical protein
MLRQHNPPFRATEGDAELEWLLCLASAVQAREQQAAKSAAKDEPHPFRNACAKRKPS